MPKVRFYICRRSLRNGALYFVQSHVDADVARRVADMANHGQLVAGPRQFKYEVVNSR